MEIVKSSRHQKIIGNFGENLVCNWLSRSGFEVSIVDHTGLDIIAYNPSTKERFGITVKSRTRTQKSEKGHVYLLKSRKNDRDKLIDACEAFACEPWIGVYVETLSCADLYLTSLENYDKNYRTKEGKAVDDWKMSENYKKQYDKDPNVKHIGMKFEASNWWGEYKWE